MWHRISTTCHGDSSLSPPFLVAAHWANARRERYWARRTFAKYLHTVSEAELKSWLKGQALPAWQAPCRKNLQGTCDVSGGREGIVSALKYRQHAKRRRWRWRGRVGGAPTEAAERCEVSGEGQGRKRLTWGASGPLKASGGHCANHATGAAALRRNVEAAAAHMAMLARVGGGHRDEWFRGEGVGHGGFPVSQAQSERFWSFSVEGRPELRARLMIEGQRGPLQCAEPQKGPTAGMTGLGCGGDVGVKNSRHAAADPRKIPTE